MTCALRHKPSALFPWRFDMRLKLLPWSYQFQGVFALCLSDQLYRSGTFHALDNMTTVSLLPNRSEALGIHFCLCASSLWRSSPTFHVIPPFRLCSSVTDSHRKTKFPLGGRAFYRHAQDGFHYFASLILSSIALASADTFFWSASAFALLSLTAVSSSSSALICASIYTANAFSVSSSSSFLLFHA